MVSPIEPKSFASRNANKKSATQNGTEHEANTNNSGQKNSGNYSRDERILKDNTFKSHDSMESVSIDGVDHGENNQSMPIDHDDNEQLFPIDNIDCGDNGDESKDRETRNRIAKTIVKTIKNSHSKNTKSDRLQDNSGISRKCRQKKLGKVFYKKLVKMSYKKTGKRLPITKLRKEKAKMTSTRRHRKNKTTRGEKRNFMSRTVPVMSGGNTRTSPGSYSFILFQSEYSNQIIQNYCIS